MKPFAPFNFLPRTVIVLGVVSLLNDSASEMITPLLPIFLTSVLGSGPAVVGLVEGMAESTAGVLKLISGRLADRGIDPKLLVTLGYGASNLARPLIGVALIWPTVLVLRFVDRIGKGIRTAPRDAMIAGVTVSGRRGAAFGFHRSMDHAGAVIGPLFAFALLESSVSLTKVFYYSAIPGALVVMLLILGVPSRAPLETVSAPSSLKWSALDARLKAMIVSAGALALSAVPEAFVVLWARNAGLAVSRIPLLWALASLAKMCIAMPAGILSDRIGRLPVWTAALGLRVATLLSLAFIEAKGQLVWILFLTYAISLALAEPVERSIIGDRAASDLRGTAFGLYHLASGLLALPGAFAFGLIWEYASASAAFQTAAAITVVAALPMAILANPSDKA